MCLRPPSSLPNTKKRKKEFRLSVCSYPEVREREREREREVQPKYIGSIDEILPSREKKKNTNLETLEN
jgi:hypothetical protein